MHILGNSYILKGDANERIPVMKYSIGTVISIKKIGEGIFDLRVAEPGIAKDAKPGQFVCLYSDDGAHLLPRPISICEKDDESVRLVFRIAGYGTKEFSEKKPGDTVRILGPIGNPYPEFAQDLIVVGGGIGIPPMLYLARKCKEAGLKVTTVLGYRDKNTFLDEEFRAYGDVVIATDNGDLGVHGTVVDAIREKGLDVSLVCACGPMPMLKGLSKYVLEKGGRCYVSLEERMACGVGACLGCITKTKQVDGHSHVKNQRICTEGPVFDASELDW